MAFEYTTAISKLRRLTKRYKCVPGGTSAGKTYGIIPILVDKAIKTPNLSISIISESMPHLRMGAMKDFLDIMRDTGRYIDDHWNRSSFTYNFVNGSYINFFSADQPGKVQGPRRKISYINEASNIPFEIFHHIAIRSLEEVWLDWNPSREFWAYEEMLNDPDAEWLTLTYKDNEALPAAVVKDIEKAKEKAKTSAYWENWWKVYGLGELGLLEGVIFDNWQLIDKIPEEAKLIGYGLDFGYTNDPTAVVQVYQWNNKRILNEVCYRTGLVNAEIAELIPANVTVYADSAEPKSIEEIRRLKKRILPVRKGADSINFGIQVMQAQEYLVTKNSVNLIKELRNYMWDKDKLGKTLNKPIDAFNHGIDAVRYHEMMTVGLRRNRVKARSV